MEKSTNLFQKFLGIDISKLTLDYCLSDSSGKQLFQSIVKNTPQGITELFKQLKAQKIDHSQLLICYENSGVYTMLLNTLLTEMKVHFWVVPPIEIKRSKGLSRGKSDKKDAKDISLYALKNVFNFKQYVMPDKELTKLKLLQTQRVKLLDCIKSLEMFSENKNFYSKDILKDMSAPPFLVP
jgi:transposase